MRLPWVSREAYELLRHNYGEAWIQIRAERTIAETRYDALLEKFTALRLQGATTLPPVVPYTPKEADSYDELKALIADQAGPDLRRRGMMLRQLKKDREDGISADEIRRSIETGVVPDGVPV